MRSVSLLLLTLITPLSVVAQDAAPAKFTAAEHKFFADEVLPILQQHCFQCHGEGKVRGNLRLINREAVLAGGDLGAAVDLSQPAESHLLQAINYRELEMPPKGKLPAEKIAVLTKWVKLGVPFDPRLEKHVEEAPSRAPVVDEAARNFWAFQPVKRPAVPKVNNAGWVQSPIDAFVLSKLEQANLQPAPAASKAALLRRAYYDLIGLPPTPAQVDAFLADRSPQAFEKVVNELLESPHYGERWGRHWLDLVRYAESNSYERDNPKPFVWRYRDYVIRSFNDDKPYTEFIREQLAGDEYDEITPDRRIATGYYRLGIWQDEPVDPVQELYEDLDDIVRTTGEVFLGLTIGCCRCHDHKIDPLPQTDYYQFMAFFHGLNRYGIRGQNTIENFSVRPIATPEDRVRQAEAIAKHNQRIAKLEEELAVIEKLVYDDFQDVEKEEFRHEQHKIPLVRKRVGKKLITPEQMKTYAAGRKQLLQLRRNPPNVLSKALCVTEIGPQARETFVLIRGNAHARGDRVEPGFPTVLGFPAPEMPAVAADSKTSGRRMVLANWLANDANPLTARVMVNRIWQYHFGRGIVRSASNYGYGGDKPTHPQLLDWLAADFVQGGWTLKRMHKMIMLSSTYQMASTANAEALAADPINQRFWRFDMRRLSAEEIRDSILAVNASLNPKMFGASIYPKIPAEVMAGQSRPGANWGNSSPEDRARRSIYIHTKRSMLVPFIDAFDGADPDFSCPVRFVTTQPTQALGMMNSEFMNTQAHVFAEFLRDAATDSDARVKLALQRTLQRKPTPQEESRGKQLLADLKSKYQLSEEQALDKFCLVVLNLNEFIYVD